jgi:hypothetical protein
VASVPGDPPDADERLRVVLDPNDPTKSVAILPKPHPGPGPDPEAEAEAEADPTPHQD